MRVRILLVLAVLIVTANISAQKTIRITNGEWPPFFSEYLDHGGKVTHIITRAFELEGIDVVYGWFPWKRALHYAKTGVWDASAGWARKEELEDILIYSDPVFEGRIVFFHLKGKEFDWKTLSDLKNKKIGAIIGFNYSKEFLEAERKKEIIVERTNTEVQNFRMLLTGRIDVFICNIDVGFSYLKGGFTSEEIELITYNKKPFFINKLRIAFSKKNPENIKTVKAFNRGLKRLIDSGEYIKIYNEFE